MPAKISSKDLANMYAELENAPAPVVTPVAPVVVQEARPKVLNIIRYLAKDNTTAEGRFAVADVNYYLSEKIDQGYRLFNTHYLSENPEGFGVLYVLVLNE